MPRKRKTKIDRAKTLLEAYAETCNIAEACRKAGVTRKTHYDWLEKYPEYKAAFELRKRSAAEDLEAEAFSRAKLGWEDDVHYQGQVCGSVKRYSDGLAMFLLRGMMPEKYGVQRQEISGPQGTPMQVNVKVNFVKPSDSDNA